MAEHLKRQIIEVSDVVARAIEMSSPLLEQRSHRLRVDVPRQLWPRKAQWQESA